MPCTLSPKNERWGRLMNAADWDAKQARRQLIEDGYCHVPGVLDAASVQATRAVTAAALGTIDAAHRAQWKSEGSLIALADHPPFAVLIAHARPVCRSSAA